MPQHQKRVAITGAASGLGQALAARYASAGWKVAVSDLEQGTCDETLKMIHAAGGESLACSCDVRSNADLEQFAATVQTSWGGIDVVINNAGVAGGGPFQDVSLEDWEWLLDINLMGVVRGCKAFTPMMISQGSGRLINIASMAGLIAPPGMAHYNASKAAVVALSETLRAELEPFGIDVSVVCPSFFRTNLLDSFRGPDQRSRKLVEKLFERGKLSATDVADCVFQHSERDQFLILPHAEGRKAWRTKRYLPDLLHREMLKFGRKAAGK